MRFGKPANPKGLKAARYDCVPYPSDGRQQTIGGLQHRAIINLRGSPFAGICCSLRRIISLRIRRVALCDSGATQTLGPDVFRKAAAIRSFARRFANMAL